nr:MAG TPA: hypothetical protein [Caudoviricetes sp.]
MPLIKENSTLYLGSGVIVARRFHIPEERCNSYYRNH